MAKKETLKITDPIQATNHILYAISSAENELRIGMLLNQHVNILLSLSDPVKIVRRGAEISFPTYRYEHDEGIEKFILFVNRKEGAVLFTDFKQVDFFLLVIADSLPVSLPGVLGELRAQQVIQSFHIVPSAKVRGLSGFLEQ